MNVSYRLLADRCLWNTCVNSSLCSSCILGYVSFLWNCTRSAAMLGWRPNAVLYLLHQQHDHVRDLWCHRDGSDSIQDGDLEISDLWQVLGCQSCFFLCNHAAACTWSLAVILFYFHRRRHCLHESSYQFVVVVVVVVRHLGLNSETSGKFRPIREHWTRSRNNCNFELRFSRTGSNLMDSKYEWNGNKLKCNKNKMTKAGFSDNVLDTWRAIERKSLQEYWHVTPYVVICKLLTVSWTRDQADWYCSSIYTTDSSGLSKTK